MNDRTDQTINDSATSPSQDHEADSRVLNQEERLTMAALEWLMFGEEQLQMLRLGKISIVEEYVEASNGNLPLNGMSLVKWIGTYGMGAARTPGEVRELVARRLFAEKQISSMLYKAGLNRNLADKKATANGPAIEPGLISQKLPSGATFYWSPYDMESPAGRVWLKLTAATFGLKV